MSGDKRECEYTNTPILISKWFFIILFTHFFYFTSTAQTNYNDKLAEAASAYDNGDISKVIELANVCLSSSEISDKAQAYRLLAMAYLINNQSSDALNAAVKMLELNPRYKPDLLKDPKEFTQLLSKIDVVPAFSLGLAGMYGLNSTHVNVIGFYAPADYTKSYSSGTGSHFRFAINYNFNNTHGLEFNIMPQTSRYSLNYEVFEKQYKVSEILRTINFPLFYKFNFRKGKAVRLFAGAGFYSSVLLHSYNDFIISSPEGKQEIKHYGSRTRRNTFNYGVAANAGVNIKFREGHITAGICYFKALSNFTDAGSRYKNPVLVYDYLYLDDDFRMDSFMFSVGYSKYLNFKVRK
ncbi:MAG: outer membrane beta-barrel protein [Bacteroidetes bacterium]|nr:outer membrane beta-barrel protein [Bacteroidota bacterium]